MKIAVRIDDITPDMDWESFYRFKELLDQYEIKPLIGIVPDNQDKNLMRDKKREDFWIYIKELYGAGWSIGLHGYQHVYTTKKGGLFPLNHFSEFAGVSYEKQKEMLVEGKKIFQEHGITTDIFMAPGHSYDRNTLNILSELGFRYVTDGFGNQPYMETQSGLVFLPIAFQSEKDINKSKGYTTLVYHLNGMTAKQFKKHEKIIREHKESFISYEDYSKVVPISRLFAGRVKEKLLVSMKYFLVRIRTLLRR